MHNRLRQILADKRAEVAEALQHDSLDAVRDRAASAPPVRDFAAALKQQLDADKAAVIAEIKFASPAAGQLQPASVERALAIAESYASAGATCLSVLTDSKYFTGSFDFLAAIRQTSPLPLLCKDFMLHPWQIWRAREHGADAVLLIAAALPDESLDELALLAAQAGVSVLAEVHDEDELERVLGLDSLSEAVIGINNRNLTTFQTSLEVTVRLAKQVPSERLLVSESGISTAADLQRLGAAGVRAFLVGEALMRNPDPGEQLAELLAVE